MQRNTFHAHIVHYQSARRPSLPAPAMESSAVGIGRDPSGHSEKWSTHLHYRAALRACQSRYDQLACPSPRRADLLCFGADCVLSGAAQSSKIGAQRAAIRLEIIKLIEAKTNGLVADASTR